MGETRGGTRLQWFVAVLALLGVVAVVVAMGMSSRPSGGSYTPAARPSASPPPVAEPVPPQGSISGVVRERDGSPARDMGVVALLQVEGSEEVYFSTAVDDRGRYVLRDLPVGEYEVAMTAQAAEEMPALVGTGSHEAYRQGFERRWTFEDPRGATPEGGSRVVVTEGEETTGVDAVVPPTSSLIGRVVDAAGTPLPRAQVDLYVDGPAPVSDLARAGARTDREGRYRFERLRPGTYRIHVPGASEEWAAVLDRWEQLRIVQVPRGAGAVEVDLTRSSG